MNIIWPSSRKQHEIRQGAPPEDHDANFDRLFQDIAAQAAAIIAYKIDLANDVDTATALALARLAGYDASNTSSFLRNDGTWAVPPNPTGYVPQVGSRNVGWAQVDAGSTRIVGLTESTAGASSLTADSAGFWWTLTTNNAAGASVNYGTNSKIVRADHNPLFDYYLRTGPVITATRLWIGLFSTDPTNVDDLAGATKAICFRFSTVAGDAGWTPITRDGATQAAGTTIGTVAASTKYRLRATLSGNGTSVDFSVNGGAAQTIALTGLTGTNLELQGFLFTTTNTAKVLDFGRLYYERD